MTTSSNGISFIKSFEGFASCPYVDPGTGAEPITIGYGTTIYPTKIKVKLTDKCITENQAIDYLKNDLIKFEKIVNSKITVELNQNQFDALVSHTYNTGGSTTLFNLINSKESQSVIKDWFEKKYITSGKKILRGLVRRRSEESKLYYK